MDLASYCLFSFCKMKHRAETSINGKWNFNITTSLSLKSLLFLLNIFESIFDKSEHVLKHNRCCMTWFWCDFLICLVKPMHFQCVADTGMTVSHPEGNTYLTFGSIVSESVMFQHLHTHFTYNSHHRGFILFPPAWLLRPSPRSNTPFPLTHAAETHTCLTATHTFLFHILIFAPVILFDRDAHTVSMATLNKKRIFGWASPDREPRRRKGAKHKHRLLNQSSVLSVKLDC